MKIKKNRDALKIGMALVLMTIMGNLSFAEDNPLIHLRVTRMTTTKNTNKSRDNYYQDPTRSVAIRIAVTNMKATPSKVTLEWFFVAKVQTGNTRWVFDKGTEEVTVDAKTLFDEPRTSKDLVEAGYSYLGSGSRTAYGDKIEGYIVRVMSGTKILAIAASSNPLEQIGRDPVKLEALIKAAE